MKQDDGWKIFLAGLIAFSALAVAFAAAILFGPLLAFG